MRKRLSYAAASLALLFLAAASATAAEPRTLHTHVPEVAARLRRIERLPATDRLRLAIGIPLDRKSVV